MLTNASQKYLRMNSFVSRGLYPNTPFCEWYSLEEMWVTEEVTEVVEVVDGLVLQTDAQFLISGFLLRTPTGILRRLSNRFILTLQWLKLYALQLVKRDIEGEPRKREAEVKGYNVCLGVVARLEWRHRVSADPGRVRLPLPRRPKVVLFRKLNHILEYGIFSKIRLLFLIFPS